MGKYRPLANLNEDVRLLILSLCGFPQSLSLMRITKAWYLSYKNTRVWKQIYYNTFADFNPRPGSGNSNWLDEIKDKIRIYGTNYDEYKHLLGNVKIRWKLDPPIDVRAGAHIHKTLGLYINERLLPFMGYFGPQEVCYNDWIKSVFKPMLQKFDSNEVNEFRWDFCDQGMPEFVFEKEGPICKLSIAEGICGGKADPDWQQVPFLIEDLRVEVVRFLEELHQELVTKYGNNGQEFWNELGVEIKDGTFFGFSDHHDSEADDWSSSPFDFQSFANNIATSINNNKTTINNVPTGKHVFFGSSSSSESSEDEIPDQSAHIKNKNKKEKRKKKKKESRKRKYPSNSSSSSEEKKPKKKRR